jgi:hypothetical protein
MADKYKIKEKILTPSTLESIDQALFNFCEKDLNIFCTTNKGWKKVPVIWVSAERAYQIKSNKSFRDSSGSVILPVISIERKSVVKDLTKRGASPSDVPAFNDEKGGSIVIARRINQTETSKFANIRSERVLGEGKINRRERNVSPCLSLFGKKVDTPKNRNPVFETISIPMPIFLDITYSVNIKTEYQQQMNEIITPFMTKPGGINYFLLKHNDHRYEAFIQGDFSQGNNITSLNEEERRYETTIDIKVLGYIIGSEKNQERPKVVIRQSFTDVKINRETTIYGDIPEHAESVSFRGPSPKERDDAFEGFIEIGIPKK